MQITELLDNNRDQSFYDLNAQLKPAVADLIERNPSTKPGPESFVFGQGEWRVFHAPHIVQLSGALGARFDPIVYRLDGQKIVSNVRYKHPLLGSGWLSASGACIPLAHAAPVCTLPPQRDDASNHAHPAATTSTL